MRNFCLLLVAAISCAFANNDGYATYFNAVGYPYGACGVSDSVAWNEAAIDTPSGQGNPFHYVALNVFDDSGNYSSPSIFGTRPLTGADTVYLGTYQNGKNCGRWIKVTLGDYCNGTNDGAANESFCRNGSGWASDALDSASLDVIVFDQCTDGNAWCRDAKYHLDLHTPNLTAFKLDGKVVPLATPNSTPVTIATSYTVNAKVFNNRKISWNFETAPNYQGEPRFYFSVDSKPYYMRILVTHLPNGIHGVEQYVNGTWKPATMQSDMGQMWILPDAGATTFKLRLTDADDKLVMDGRTWTIHYPAACNSNCSGAATPADDVVGEGGDISTAVPKVAATISVPHLATRGREVQVLAPAATRVDFLSPVGALLGSAAIADGAAHWTAPRAGLLIVRWYGAQTSGTLRTIVP